MCHGPASHITFQHLSSSTDHRCTGRAILVGPRVLYLGTCMDFEPHELDNNIRILHEIFYFLSSLASDWVLSLNKLPYFVSHPPPGNAPHQETPRIPLRPHPPYQHSSGTAYTHVIAKHRPSQLLPQILSALGDVPTTQSFSKTCTLSRQPGPPIPRLVRFMFRGTVEAWGG